MPSLRSLTHSSRTVLSLRLSDDTANDPQNPSILSCLKESPQFGIPNPHCKEFERVSIANINKRQSSIHLTLNAEDLFTENTGYWGFSALCSIGETVVEEKFADYEKDRRSHVDSDLSNGQIKSPLEYTFTSLDVSSGDTVSVAFFIYTTDSQGVRTAEPQLFTVLSARLVAEAPNTAPRLNIDFLKLRKHPFLPENPKPPKPTSNLSTSMQRTNSGSSSSSKPKVYNPSVGYRILGATSAISSPSGSAPLADRISPIKTTNESSPNTHQTRTFNGASKDLATELLRRASRDVAKDPIRIGSGKGKEKEVGQESIQEASMEWLKDEIEKKILEEKESKSEGSSKGSTEMVRKRSESKLIRNRYSSKEEKLSDSSSHTSPSHRPKTSSNDSSEKGTTEVSPETHLRAWSQDHLESQNPTKRKLQAFRPGETGLRKGWGELDPGKDRDWRHSSRGERERASPSLEIPQVEREQSPADSVSYKEFSKTRGKEVNKSRHEIRKRMGDEREGEGRRDSRRGSSRDSRRDSDRESRRERRRESRKDDRSDSRRDRDRHRDRKRERERSRSRDRESKSRRESRNHSPKDREGSSRRESESRKESKTSTPSNPTSKRTKLSPINPNHQEKEKTPDYDLSKEEEEVRVLRQKVAEERKKVETLSKEITRRKELEAQLAELRQPQPQTTPSTPTATRKSNTLSPALASNIQSEQNGSHHSQNSNESRFKRKHEPEGIDERRYSSGRREDQGEASSRNSTSRSNTIADELQEDPFARNSKNRKLRHEPEQRPREVATVSDSESEPQNDDANLERSSENVNGVDLSDSESESDRSLS